MARCIWSIVLAGLVGCGSVGEGPKVQVKMEDVPAAAMKTAKEKVPGMTFTEAFMKRMELTKFVARPRPERFARWR